MRLKHIKLVGFKSFVDATTVPFPEQMTAIVGPNGCGKSNVIDAVRWVLGESSAKNLRGDAMTDVIFNGSTHRKPVSQASVELVFDNTEGRLAGNLADRSEISVKRLVTKESVSTYFLNGAKCRRRDITDIFLGTGLGPRSYAIIEQGMISRLIESKPQELRIFLEEAAGISKYKERRRETETRIKHTRENLSRLADVREELATQLEKLKRQAATARRYKDLKKAERQFKAELTALKWHKYNEQLNFHEQERLKKETELEAFIAEQRGGELGLITQKERLHVLNEKIQNYQSQVFATSNEITRVEQKIVFEQENKNKQTSQLAQLQDSIQQAEEHLLLERDEFEELETEIAEREPQLEIHQAQVDEATDALVVAETNLEQHQQNEAQKVRELAHAQQNLKLIENKIHHQQIELAKLVQHQQDLQSEIKQFDDNSLQCDLAEFDKQASLLKQEIEQIQETLTEQITRTERSEQNWQVAKDEESDAQQNLLNCQTKLVQLQQWQKEYENSLEESKQTELTGTSAKLLISQLDVEPQWQSAVEQLLSHHGQAWLVDNLPSDALTQKGQFVCAADDSIQSNSGINEETDTGEQTPLTLPSIINNGVYPGWFDQVALAQNIEEAHAQLSADSNKMIIAALLPTGQWVGSNWTGIGGPTTTQETGVMARLAQIADLESELSNQHGLLEKCRGKTLELQRLNEHESDTLREIKRGLSVKETQLHDVLLEQRLAQQNWTHLSSQHEKLQQELHKTAEQIEYVSATLEALQEEQLIGQEQELECQSNADTIENDKTRISSQVTEKRQVLSGATNALHQFSLQHQQLNSKKDNLQQNIQRASHHITQLKQQYEDIQSQQINNVDDAALLQEQLEQLLQTKLEQEEALQQVNTEAAEVDEAIRTLEQGQSGIVAKLDQMKGEIADIKMNSEGARVRAQNTLEVLVEMNLKIKDVLATMPPEAEEQEWAAQLEKTSNSIQRLGAINLAAIDEYEVQAERKGYLDTQFDDLTQALEVLEAAIRKIDRESKSKFKATFDQVNDGLQTLFPKVFGGGAAYLELTDDDLLETGVTIMARPPGKKNSTIHLLSGGEKALTALSLVFSIFQLNPAPFCMLDEVDAPLDDANVGRFCKLVNEMSGTVQFIYISHNKVAMEMATHLTGVTMQEPGVSRLVAVDIQQAVEMAEAS